MTLEPALQIAAFAVFSLIAVAGALGMATTMSMFRSGIFLMASFIGVAGLFILLLADLVALLQVMMYIGGMLVMILFMVLFSHDPGGRMMTGMMELPILEKFFSLGLAEPGGHGAHGGGGQSHESGAHDDMGGMSMADMSMTTPIKGAAAGLAVAVGGLLTGAIVWRSPWPVQSDLPAPDSPARIGHLLMGKYMIAFEGAGLLILLGIFGAIFLSRPDRHPDPSDRASLRAAVDAPPGPVDSDGLAPERPDGDSGEAG